MKHVRICPTCGAAKEGYKRTKTSVGEVDYYKCDCGIIHRDSRWRHGLLDECASDKEATLRAEYFTICPGVIAKVCPKCHCGFTQDKWAGLRFTADTMRCACGAELKADQWLDGMIQYSRADINGKKMEEVTKIASELKRKDEALKEVAATASSATNLKAAMNTEKVEPSGYTWDGLNWVSKTKIVCPKCGGLNEEKSVQTGICIYETNKMFYKCSSCGGIELDFRWKPHTIPPVKTTPLTDAEINAAIKSLNNDETTETDREIEWLKKQVRELRKEIDRLKESSPKAKFDPIT